MRKDYTHLSIVLDRSGSMSNIAKDMEGGLRAFIEEQKKVDGKCTVSLYRFDNTIDKVYDFIDIQDAGDFQLQPRGGTALNDAVGYAIKDTGQKLALLNEADRPALVTVMIITDGGENASKEYKAIHINQMVTEQTAVYNWQFNYLGANQDAFKEGGNIGVHHSNRANFNVNKSAEAWSNYNSKMKGARGMSAVNNIVGAAEILTYTNEDKKELE